MVESPDEPINSPNKHELLNEPIDDSEKLPHIPLDQAHEEFPDKFLFYTEACNGTTYYYIYYFQTVF